MNYQTKIITKLDKKLLSAWESLWNESKFAHPFNSPAWFHLNSKLENFKEYKILTITNNQKLVGILPLVYSKKFGIHILQSPGGKYLDRSSLLIKSIDSEIITVLFNALKKEKDVFLHELPEDIAKMIKETDPTVTTIKVSVSPYLLLENNPYRFVPSDVKNKIVNRLKKNESHIIFKTFFGNKDSLTIAIELDKRSSKEKQGKQTFSTDYDIQFFEELLHMYKKDFIVDILYFDEIPFAYSIGLRYKNTFHAISTAYDEKHKYLQPGKTLLYFILQRLSDDKLEFFDFSRGLSSVKRDFTPFAATQYDIVLTNNKIIKLWWIFIENSRRYILSHKTLYGIYLKIKKVVI